ncbi:MAG: radical SAM protein [Deltaproteobacteria bacterium]|nr:MAG: radical SAM protein [Deltaproteobacteria bacterium]
MKNTISITQQCNLRCDYCYIDKHDAVMSAETAARVIDFIYANSPPGERIEIGLFGGEPLTAFAMVRHCTELVKNHAAYDPNRVSLSLVTNGTIFTEEIAGFLKAHDITFCLSCDGPPAIHDRFRRFPDGRGSSALIENTLRQALEQLPAVLVNSVYSPETLPHLPEVVDYFISFGLRKIYVNANFGAQWTARDAALLPEVFSRLAERYCAMQLTGDPCFISIIDSKLAVILKKGYAPRERCRMGRGEFAFTPSGRIYPCERLIGADKESSHSIGTVSSGIDTQALGCQPRSDSTNQECMDCSLRQYCMHWCGCSNFFSTGRYDRVGPFLCASEQAAISTAHTVFESLSQRLGASFFDRMLNGGCSRKEVAMSRERDPPRLAV